MNLNLFLTVFATVFLAELGDKTQLATLLYSTKQSVSLMTVFLGASLALITATGIAVAGGAIIVQYVDPKYLTYVAGLGFILVGIWTLWSA
ncbi:MAG: TMEM165/GDT1 family protein [Proteobacteria bacterium]|jgi:putative Ca2+/H+ antiporter (TMEM165/GDT1 family)|nr:TMEM165/GDT1 family protein [Pseudomonadota bacterium]MDA0994360.1 TMEM165/GDT1 family protein [Pseudomonadota bacterium]